MVASSPPREQIMTVVVEPEYQTPPGTKSTPESTIRFYEQSVAKASRMSPEAPLNCSEHTFFIDIPMCLKIKKIFQ